MNLFYPTASTVAAFLNGNHIEQAYQIQYKETVNKSPIFGYNDYFYTKVAEGKTIVQGVLIVNFVFAGYLNSVISASNIAPHYVPRLYNYDIPNLKANVRLTKGIKEELKTELPVNSSIEDRKARAAYIANLLNKDRNTREATKKALESFWVATDVDDRFNIRSLPSPLNISNDGALLDVYYQDPEQSTWFVQFDKVHFYENSQVISQAGAEGSADNLFEVYSWLASSKKIKLVGELS